MTKLLSVKDLEISYQVSQQMIKAVRAVSFEVEQGSSLAIVGESGSGKSSICYAVMGFHEHNATIKGEILFNKSDLLSMSKKKIRKLYSRDISLLPQSINSLNPLMTIGTQIQETLTARNNSGSGKILKSRILKLLSMFRIEDVDRIYNSYPFQLSGGLNQRALMSVAFCKNPSMIVADEPTRSLDIELRDKIIETIRNYRRKNSVGLLLVTHDLEVAEKLSDRTAIMYNGRFVETGSTEEIFNKPAHPYTQALIQALPKNGMKPTWGFAPSLANLTKDCDFKPRCPLRKKCVHSSGSISPISLGNNHLVWCPHAHY